ncbi:hypothetical protein L0337_17855 [candidate division KSB1 bacterium]|nr:hypothetical protein [candidate division KSB1 bacterium]
MLNNYFKIALRNLLKYKGYSLINIGGLAIGIACCLLIALWVMHELSYDRFHANAGRIYRVAEIFRDNGKIVEESAGIPFPVGPTLREAFPNLQAARFYQTFEKIPLLRYGENSFYEPRLFFTDSTVFDIFSFILLLACINFMNLATARSIKRAKEIAVRKVVGAFRTQLVGQFLGESLLISFIAAFLAIILVELLLPAFARISGANLDLALIGFPKLFAGVGLLAAIVGLIAGSYPALFLSSYLPVEGLRLKSNRGAGAITALFRKGLVVFQFCISIALLVGTAVIYQQHQFLQQKELGFDKEQIVMIPIRGTSIKPQVEAFKARLRQDAAVLDASAVSNIIGRDVQVCPFGAEGKTEVLQMPGLFVDHDFIKTFGVQLQQGRGFDIAYSTDSTAFLLNQAAVNLIEWPEPLGKRMKFGPEGQVIGVVQDFNYASLRERIRPMAILIRPGWFSYVAVRLAHGDIQSSLRELCGYMGMGRSDMAAAHGWGKESGSSRPPRHGL